MEATAQKHIGRNISRIREMRGMKQETLAELLGVSQQKVSLLENAEELEDTKLEPIAKALEIPLDALKNFSEDAFFNIIANTYNNTSNDNSTLIASSVNYYPTFNPLDKLLESYEENRRLYERLLETEREKSKVIEELVRKVMRD
ncbi:helix-turn-helix domain-containing protein [Chryseobacterium koreense]|uniref:helix-turn-helix domain-containing protein n=1 Tax=Chryseobacterium koreense TaxID=232216 RepID=UPI0026EE195D|nr:helix-turn-helix transcriptional regulator [Chryseobacterium koreense]